MVKDYTKIQHFGTSLLFISAFTDYLSFFLSAMLGLFLIIANEYIQWKYYKGKFDIIDIAVSFSGLFIGAIIFKLWSNFNYLVY